jgi:hypothetical protein
MTERNATQLTVNLVPKALDALKAAADQTGDTQTDTVNVALQVYARIIQAHDEGRGSAVLRWTATPGARVVVEVNRRPWWQRRWSR